MQSPLNRRWYHSSWLILLVIGGDVWAITNVQLEKQFGGFNSSFGYLVESHYGWPLIHFCEYESGSFRGNVEPTFTYVWRWIPLLLNLLFALLLIISAIVCVNYLRRSKWYQVSMGTLFSVMAVMAILLTLYLQLPNLWYKFSPAGWDRSYIFVEDFSVSFSYWPLLFSIVCMVFTFVRIMSWVIGLTYRTLLRVHRGNFMPEVEVDSP